MKKVEKSKIRFKICIYTNFWLLDFNNAINFLETSGHFGDFFFFFFFNKLNRLYLSIKLQKPSFFIYFGCHLNIFELLKAKNNETF